MRQRYGLSFLRAMEDQGGLDLVEPVMTIPAHSTEGIVQVSTRSMPSLCLTERRQHSSPGFRHSRIGPREAAFRLLHLRALVRISETTLTTLWSKPILPVPLERVRIFLQCSLAGGGFRAGLFSPNGLGAGVFAVNAHFSPAVSAEDGGFRCVQYLAPEDWATKNPTGESL
jgi:hypothetical protein